MLDKVRRVVLTPNIAALLEDSMLYRWIYTEHTPSGHSAQSSSKTALAIVPSGKINNSALAPDIGYRIFTGLTMGFLSVNEGGIIRGIEPILRQGIDRIDWRIGELEQVAAHLAVGLRGDVQKIANTIEMSANGALVMLTVWLAVHIYYKMKREGREREYHAERLRALRGLRSAAGEATPGDLVSVSAHPEGLVDELSQASAKCEDCPPDGWEEDWGKGVPPTVLVVDMPSNQHSLFSRRTTVPRYNVSVIYEKMRWVCALLSDRRDRDDIHAMYYIDLRDGSVSQGINLDSAVDASTGTRTNLTRSQRFSMPDPSVEWDPNTAPAWCCAAIGRKVLHRYGLVTTGAHHGWKTYALIVGMQALRTVDESYLSDAPPSYCHSHFAQEESQISTLLLTTIPPRPPSESRSFEFHATQQEITSLSYSDSVDRLSHILKITAQHDVLLLPVVEYAVERKWLGMLLLCTDRCDTIAARLKFTIGRIVHRIIFNQLR
ncbi:hypothetical protein F5J12DRAFT_784275 [Pisolithus orientalis]|uniref:uncharacterized protein n=1 Tax=Pisolithus orientalis TaxID=936130 RepID=UPI002224E8B3|nr:uncharacterized protein F5J12DRAFT_784275 [Pisolithus orientalis]KAI6001055.1 hypothetical protein F5J12DRAFT_784275 [Pisolithus orientalis]